jgi:transcriptional regulator with XRE-family HTH domain
MDHPLKQYRVKMELTQEEAARQFGVTKATVSRWEAGVRFPERAQLLRLSTITGIPVADLIEVREPAE